MESISLVMTSLVAPITTKSGTNGYDRKGSMVS